MRLLRSSTPVPTHSSIFRLIQNMSTPALDAADKASVFQGPWNCSKCKKSFVSPSDMPFIDDDETYICRPCCNEEDAEFAVVMLEAGCPGSVTKELEDGTYRSLSLKPSDVATPYKRQLAKKAFLAFLNDGNFSVVQPAKKKLSVFQEKKTKAAEFKKALQEKKMALQDKRNLEKNRHVKVVVTRKKKRTPTKKQLAMKKKASRFPKKKDR